MAIIYYILSSLVFVYGIYFVSYTFSLFKKNPRMIGHHASKHKIAVFIAARNEESVIKTLIESLSKQNYPKKLYDIIVIPNNCTDHTEEEAKAAGAKIFHCTGSVKNKGQVLNQAFSYYVPRKEYDAYLIFDADNVVNENYIRRMNDALCEGYLVATGKREAKNPYDTYLSGNYTVFYLIQNVFFNQTRMNLGHSSSINGTGFIIHESYLEKYGYEPKSLTEDMELMAYCAEHRVKIGYVSDAVTYDEQPTTFVTSWKQRKRWVVGNYQCLVWHFKSLIYSIVVHQNREALDALLVYLSPVCQFLSIFSVILGFFVVPLIPYLLSLGIGAILLYLGAIGICFLAVSYEGKKPKRFMGGLLTFPIFVLTWLPLNIIYLFKKDQNWEHIKHHRNLKEEEIIKNNH